MVKYKYECADVPSCKVALLCSAREQLWPDVLPGRRRRRRRKLLAETRNNKLQVLAKLNDCVNRKFIIVYADDFLLIVQSVSELRNLLRACEKELITIDMKINVKKSCCMRVGTRCNATCANLNQRWSIFTMGL